MTLLDRNLVDTDDLRGRRPGSPELLPHVLLLQSLHRVPVQVQFLGHVLDRRRPTPTANIESEPFRVERIVRQEGQLLLLHLAASRAFDSTNLGVQEDTHVPARLVSYPPSLPIVEAPVPPATRPARRFFDRRCNSMTLAYRSPNTPATVGLGRNPGNR